LGIKVTDGIETTIGGVLKAAHEPVFFHNVKIQVANNWCISVKAGFTKKLYERT